MLILGCPYIILNCKDNQIKINDLHRVGVMFTLGFEGILGVY